MEILGGKELGLQSLNQNSIVGNGVELAMATRILFPLSKAASRKQQEMGVLIDLRMSSGPWQRHASASAIRIYS